MNTKSGVFDYNVKTRPIEEPIPETFSESASEYTVRSRKSMSANKSIGNNSIMSLFTKSSQKDKDRKSSQKRDVLLMNSQKKMNELKLTNQALIQQQILNAKAKPDSDKITLMLIN